MSNIHRRNLLGSALVMFVVVDLLGLVSFVLNQWFAVEFWQSWGLAALLALPVTMLVLPLVGTILDAVTVRDNIPMTGEKIPGTGQ
ncbi:hypothetical protein [Luteimonas aquatica]|uniref:hypothetical protein n=1 Tax=Luteimonas aquatica TaxID=450364 RepID=UPI001F5690B4|nr:hypothetical protein [Luteimonas aquatica]